MFCSLSIAPRKWNFDTKLWILCDSKFVGTRYEFVFSENCKKYKINSKIEHRNDEKHNIPRQKNIYFSCTKLLPTQSLTLVWFCEHSLKGIIDIILWAFSRQTTWSTAFGTRRANREKFAITSACVERKNCSNYFVAKRFNCQKEAIDRRTMIASSLIQIGYGMLRKPDRYGSNWGK